MWKLTKAQIIRKTFRGGRPEASESPETGDSDGSANESKEIKLLTFHLPGSSYS